MKFINFLKRILRPLKRILRRLKNLIEFFLRKTYLILFQIFVKFISIIEKLIHTIFIFNRAFNYSFFLYQKKIMQIKKLAGPKNCLKKENDQIAIILAVSTGYREPRFLRQCEVLDELNIIPLLLGQNPNPNDDYSNPNKLFFRIKNKPISNSGNYSALAKHYLIIFEAFLVKNKLLKNFRNFLGLFNHFLDNFYLDSTYNLYSFLEISQDKVNCIICHDYYFLPTAVLVSKSLNVPIIMDIHEYALKQYDFKYFNLYRTHHIHNLHSFLFKEVSNFSVVSEGIKDRLCEIYPSIKNKAKVIRNVPSLMQQFEDYKGDIVVNNLLKNKSSIKIIYSGLVTRWRGLEELLEAFPYLNTSFELFIIGPISSDGLEIVTKIKSLSRDFGRVHLLDCVPYSQIIDFNKNFDIGYYAQPIFSEQKKYVLANKLFEYMHAGLALCLDTSLEFKKLLEKHKMGWSIKDVGNKSNIIQVLNNTNIDEIRLFKQRSKEASKLYTWQKESKVLRDFLEK